MTVPVLARLRGRSDVQLAMLVLVVLAASVATHLAGAQPASGGIHLEAGEASQHGAMLLPPVLGPLGALLLFGLIRLTRGQSLGPSWFIALPALSFGLQELAERLFHTESLPLFGAEPSLAAAVLVQVAFAVVAFLVARLLRVAIRRVVAFLTTDISRSLRPRGPTISWPLASVFAPSLPALAGAHFGRAPPHLR